MECERLIGQRIGHTVRCFGKFFIKELKHYNLNFEQGVVLFAISEDLDINISHIAKELDKDKATISRAVNTLITKDFIQKTQVPNDKRTLKLSLTPSGQNALNIVLSKIKKLDDLVLASFTQEQIDTCFEVLDTMREIIEGYLKEREIS